jgi:hypothetical protein
VAATSPKRTTAINKAILAGDWTHGMGLPYDFEAARRA